MCTASTSTCGVMRNPLHEVHILVNLFATESHTLNMVEEMSNLCLYSATSCCTLESRILSVYYASFIVVFLTKWTMFNLSIVHFVPFELTGGYIPSLVYMRWCVLNDLSVGLCDVIYCRPKVVVAKGFVWDN